MYLPLRAAFLAPLTLLACSRPTPAPSELADATAAVTPSLRTSALAISVEAGHVRLWGSTTVSPLLRSVELGATKLRLDDSLAQQNGARIEVAHGTVLEWWARRREGLEQGFTIANAPAQGDQVRLTIGVPGFHARTLGHERVGLDDASGTMRWLVSDALTIDASGKSLRTSMYGDIDAVVIEVDLRGATYPITIDPTWGKPAAKLVAPDPTANAHFGIAVAAQNKRVAVTRPPNPLVDLTTSGGGAGSGAAYVFDRAVDGSFPAGAGPITSSAAHDGFGMSVALNGDTMWVGAPNGGHNEFVPPIFGSIRSFARDSTGTWNPATLVDFGYDDAAPILNLYCAGSTLTYANSVLFAGSGDCEPKSTYPGNHDVGVFRTTGGAPSALSTSGAPGSTPTVVASITDAGLIAVGYPYDKSVTPGAGSVALLTLDAGGMFYILGPTLRGSVSAGPIAFGSALGWSAVSGTSPTVVSTLFVGAPGEGGGRGAIYLYDVTFSDPGMTSKVSAPTKFLGPDGGAFGSTIAVDGNTAIVGAPTAGGIGAAYIFTKGASGWVFDRRVLAPDYAAGDAFGQSLALSGTTAAIGAPNASISGTAGAGAVYVIDLTTTSTNGTECTDANSCDSSFCVDGICCATSSCPTGQSCNVVGSLGTCAPPPPPPDAAPETSDAPASDAEAAVDAAALEGGVPLPVPPSVVRCNSPRGCASGFCVDGVCCNAPCSDRCHTCALPGSEGTCVPQPAGYDLRAECASEGTCLGTCNGAGACGPSFAGARCSNERCTGPSTAAGPAVCDGTGAKCQTQTSLPSDCTPYVCAAAFGRCVTSCLTSSDCVSGYDCDSTHACKPSTGSKGGCSMGAMNARGGAAWLLFSLGAWAVVWRRRRRAYLAALAVTGATAGCGGERARVTGYESTVDAASPAVSLRASTDRVSLTIDASGARLASAAAPEVHVGIRSLDGMSVDAASVSGENGMLARNFSHGSEWWVPRGSDWELGWTIARRPEGAAGSMRLSLAVAGLSSSRDRAGRVALSRDGIARYFVRDLFATDAGGRTLHASLQPTAEGFDVVVDTTVAAFPIVIDPLVSVAEGKVTGVDTAARDTFGNSLTFVVSSGVESLMVGTPCTGPSGCGIADGAVYSFTYDGAAWSQQQKIVDTATSPSSGFGYGVGAYGGLLVVTSNGVTDYALVATSGSGFSPSGSFSTGTGGGAVGRMDISRFDPKATGTQNGTLAITDVTFEGHRPGVPGTNLAVPFNTTGASFTAHPQISASDGATVLGWGASVGASDQWIVIGCDPSIHGKPAARQPVYTFLASGAVGAYAFGPHESSRILPAETVAADGFGSALALDFIDGSSPHSYTLAIGAPGRTEAGTSSGAVYIFTATGGGAWTQQAKLIPSDGAAGDQFGASLRLNNDTLIVGAPAKSAGKGQAYVFRRAAGFWTEGAKLTASDGVAGDGYGTRVTLDGSYFAVANAPSSAIHYVYIYSRTLHPQGGPCASGADCATGFCVDSVCCSTSSCTAPQTCNQSFSLGTCASPISIPPIPEPSSSEPTTTDAGPLTDAAVASDAASDSSSATDAPSASDAATDDVPVTDAVADISVDAVPTLTTAVTACDRAHPCGTGLFCVEGVCCDSPCTDPCHSCALTNAAGHCTLEPVGVDLRGDCEQGGTCAETCGPTGSCIAAFSGSLCQKSVCTSLSTGKGPGVCTARGGTCGTPTDFNCSPYACAPAIGACVSKCGGSDDCALGFSCEQATGQCLPSPTSNGGKGGCSVGSVGRGDVASLVFVTALVALRRKRARV